MQDIKIIEADPNTGKVRFKIGSKLVSGKDLLTQVVVLSLLNVPGRDILDPDEGGGIPEMIGMNIDATDSTEVVAEVTRRIKKTQSEVLIAQAGLDLTAEEKLKELYIAGIREGESIDEILVTIRIVNEAGRITDIVV